MMGGTVGGEYSINGNFFFGGERARNGTQSEEQPGGMGTAVALVARVFFFTLSFFFFFSLPLKAMCVFVCVWANVKNRYFICRSLAQS